MLYRKKSNYLKEKILHQLKSDAANKQQHDSLLLNTEEPVSIDLNKALQNKNSKYDVVLQENDIIYIPEVNPFVTVQGKVQSPLKIAYDKDHSSLPYYIDKAGGFGVRPWRKRVFITYPNGRSKRTKNFFFMHFYPTVEEGCTITVPDRPEGKDMGSTFVQVMTATIPILITYLLVRK